MFKPFLDGEWLDVCELDRAHFWPQMQLDHGELSGGCAVLQSIVNDFAVTVRLDFFEALRGE